MSTPVKTTGIKGISTPSKRSVSAFTSESSPTTSKFGDSFDVGQLQNGRGLQPHRNQGLLAPKLAGSQTIATRSPKPKPAVGSLFNDSLSSKPGSSSAALREQIAKAKAARRVSSLNEQESQSAAQDGEFAMHEDPFNQLPSNNEHVLQKRIDLGRSDGRLNLAAMALKTIPDAVMTMYDYDPDSTTAWSESVDLTRLIIADNELEEIPDTVFPDIDIAQVAEDDDVDTNGLQFAGLEMLDAHGNRLHTIPLGMRRLERLSVLNLSYNGLGESALNIIIQIPTLRDLKLAHNQLQDALPSSIGQMTSLETLELQHNQISSLPDSVRDLLRLRILNVAGNSLSQLPFEALASLPLVDLNTSKNQLSGTLLPATVTSLPKLQTLDISNNDLTSLDACGELSMPKLQSLNMSFNRITSLPDISTWSELLTVLSEDNRLSNIPEGLVDLPKIKILDFTGNELRHVDPKFGQMESLTTLKIAANPIRERKFLTMATADLKEDLRSRLEPPATDEQSHPNAVPGVTLQPENPSSSGSLVLKPGGMLDLSSQSLTSLDNTDLSSFPSASEIRQLLLHHNALTSIPTAPLSFTPNHIRALNLSHNNISIALTHPLTLPHLTDLNLASNHLATLEPLLHNLDAPKLSTLDLSANRLTGVLPALRFPFPQLTHLLAADNQLVELPPISLRGLRIANLSNNDVEALDPQIGLLWEDGLKTLDVAGNKFRVPGWRVLEKGTESVMAWLRDRIPEEEM
jgi:Leucine-rich repeat (LRR) protein